MQDWQALLKRSIQKEVNGDSFWAPYLLSMLKEKIQSGLHLAVFVEPYLQYILEGKKTVESRFSERRIVPFGHVHKNDVILLKKSGGPIVGVCQISDIWYYRLDPKSWQQIRTEFSQMLCAQDPEFWRERKCAEFATLMSLRNVREIHPIRYSKNDRRGWVILKPNKDIT